MTINLGAGELRELKPRIIVLGVGGAGGNAVNAMINSGMQGVEFAAVNTDAQDLKMNQADAKIQIGMNLTKGLGAGAKHDIGQAAADESLNEIANYIQGANMIFITAGMGGGTGTGASHVIARAAKELNILTVGVITLPFSYEGPKRMRRALYGMEELKKYLDTAIIVPNQNLFKIANEATTFSQSFSLSNDVLKNGVQSITDLMVRPGMINLDFADVETVMSASGKAMMGTGESEGENRHMLATEAALNNPLLDDYTLKGAKGLLVNITGGEDLKLFEVDEAVNKIRAEVDPEAELIFGAIRDENLEGKFRVSIVATSLENNNETYGKSSVISINKKHEQSRHTEGGLFSNLRSKIDLRPTGFAQSSIQGATALKLDEESKNISSKDQSFETSLHQNSSLNNQTKNNEIDYTGLSFDSANYFENVLDSEDANNDVELNNSLAPNINESFKENVNQSEENSEETLKLFDEEESSENLNSTDDNFFSDLDSKASEEDEFEIPAFLRKQKF